jgi:beta-glucanase (GH16 family)
LCYASILKGGTKNHLAVALIVFLFSSCTNKLNKINIPNGYQMIWSDEFNTAGSPSELKWSYDVGDGCPKNCGWGNNELQFYTQAKTKNARVENGNLIIEAHKEKINTKEYTSSKVISKNLGDWKYAKIEVRAKLPSGKGIWPAIWMLPTTLEYGDWPSSGEIDIMEFVGYMPDSLFGTVHTKKYNHIIGTQKSNSIFNTNLSNDFHTYGIDWNENKIDFFFDGKKYLTFDNDKTGHDAWPFDKEFYLILNIAVGGNWGGKMGVDPALCPQKMLIDYVRIFQKK